MSDGTPAGRSARDDGRRAGPGTTLLVAAALAALFFGMEHLPDASTRPDFAPDQEELQADHSRADGLRRLGILGLAGLGAVGLVFGRSGRPAAGGLLGVTLAAWTAWVFASVVWSDEPGVTLRRAILFGVTLWAAAGVARLLSGRQIVWAALLAVVAQWGFGVLTELALGTFRPWEGVYRFAGTIHPNMQALQLGIGLVACTALLLRPGSNQGRWREIRGPLLCLIAAGLGAFLLLTKSRTSAGGALAAVGGAALFLSSVPTKNLLAICGTGLTAGVVIILMLSGLDPTDDVRDAALMGRAEDAGSLSGREQIWEALDPFIAERPLLGYGYLTFWSERRLDAVQTDVGFKFSGAHSAWYEMALGLGLPGLALFGVVFFAGFLRTATAEKREQMLRGAAGSPLPAFLFGVLVLALLNSLLEAIVADVRLSPFLMLCGLCKVAFFPESAPANASREPRGAAVTTNRGESERIAAPRQEATPLSATATHA